MKPSPAILLIEDDSVVRYCLDLCLRAEGYRVLEATDGRSGLEAAFSERPGLVILDLELPEMDGLHVCSALRQRGFTSPVLMLTSRGEVSERVKGLNAGADDYLPKPFDTSELLARVNALLRRQGREKSSHPAVLRFADLLVDLQQRTAIRNGVPVALTKTEYALLELLAAQAGKPVSRDVILESIWGYSRAMRTRTVDTHIWRLRRKLRDTGENPRWLRRVHGEGYCLSPQAAQERP